MHCTFGLANHVWLWLLLNIVTGIRAYLPRDECPVIPLESKSWSCHKFWGRSGDRNLRHTCTPLPSYPLLISVRFRSWSSPQYDRLFFWQASHKRGVWPDIYEHCQIYQWIIILSKNRLARILLSVQRLQGLRFRFRLKLDLRGGGKLPRSFCMTEFVGFFGIVRKDSRDEIEIVLHR